MTYKLNVFTGNFDVVRKSSGVTLTNVQCDVSTYVGAAVYMTEDGIAKNAIANSLMTSNVIGIIEEKITDTLCNIRVSGRTLDIFTNLDTTKTYYLSDTIEGGMQTTIPTNSGHIKLKLGQAFSSSVFVCIKGEVVIRL